MAIQPEKWSRYAFRTLYNCFFAGVGVVCTVVSIRDILRDDDKYKMQEHIKRHAWENAVDGNRETSKESR